MFIMYCVLDSNKMDTFDMDIFSGLENLTRFHLFSNLIPIFISFHSNIEVVCLIQTKSNHFLRMLSMVSTSYSHLLFHDPDYGTTICFISCPFSNHSSPWESNHSHLTSSMTSQISSHFDTLHNV